MPAHARREGPMTQSAKTQYIYAETLILASPFPDPIGLDAVIQWPGGVDTQLYWHTSPPSYAPFTHVPDNRVYVSPDRVEAFMHSFTAFAHGTITSDVADAPTPRLAVRTRLIDALSLPRTSVDSGWRSPTGTCRARTATR